MNYEKRLRDKLAEIKKEQDELDELRIEDPDQSGYFEIMYKLKLKQFLLEEILGIE